MMVLKKEEDAFNKCMIKVLKNVVKIQLIV